MKRPSKRLIIRVFALSVVVMLGVLAIYQAQSAMRKANDEENNLAADQQPGGEQPKPIPLPAGAETEPSPVVVDDSPAMLRLRPVSHTEPELASPAVADAGHMSAPPVFTSAEGDSPVALRAAGEMEDRNSGPALSIADEPTPAKSPAVNPMRISRDGETPFDNPPNDSAAIGESSRYTRYEEAPPSIDSSPRGATPRALPPIGGGAPSPAIPAAAGAAVGAGAASVLTSRPGAEEAPIRYPTDRIAPAEERPVEPRRPGYERSASRDMYGATAPLAVGAPSPTPDAEVGRVLGEPTDVIDRGKPGAPELEGPRTPALTIEKVAPEEIQIGKPATFAIKIRNVGKVDAEGVLVRDEIPKGTRLIDTDPPSNKTADGVILWDIGRIEAGGEKTVSMQLMPEAEGEIGSVATLAFRTQASAKTICTRPMLKLEHTGPRKVLIGENVVFKIRLSNPGTGVATGIILEEDVPEGLSHPAGQELEFEVGSLQPGETKELELTLKAAEAGLTRNTLRVHADANLLVEHSTDLEITAPDLKVGLKGPRLRYLERPAAYSITIANPGTAPAKNVDLVAHLPRGFQFKETNNSGTYDQQQHAVTWSLAELPAEQMGEVKLIVVPVETGEQKMLIESRADMSLRDQLEQEVMVEGLASLVFDISDGYDPIEVGAETQYEVRVVNEGSKTANNVQIVVAFPPDMQPLSGDGPARARVEGQNVIFDVVTRLAPKSEAVFKFRGKGLRPGDHRVRVQLASDEMERPVMKEESTRVYSDR